MSMIDLKLLTSIDKQLQKVKRSSSYSTTVFDRLLLIILIRDFYQFAPVLRKTLWNYPISQKKVHEKSLWGRFLSVLILTE